MKLSQSISFYCLLSSGVVTVYSTLKGPVPTGFWAASTKMNIENGDSEVRLNCDTFVEK